MEILTNLNISEETAIRIMIYEIRLKNPDAVRFVINPSAVKSILLYMKTRRYSTIMYLYGSVFLLEILQIFEDSENYEECSDIVRQIETHNKMVNDDIQTKIK